MPADPVVDVYLSLADLPGTRSTSFPTPPSTSSTPNGLTAHDLVVHMAAQESLLAQLVGVPTIDDLDEDDIVRPHRTRCCRGSGDRHLDGAVALWRDAVDANRRVGRRATRDRTASWRGLGLTRDDTMLVRAFETWIHADDLRRAAGFPTRARRPRHLSLMSDLAGRTRPVAGARGGRPRAGQDRRASCSPARVAATGWSDGRRRSRRRRPT